MAHTKRFLAWMLALTFCAAPALHALAEAAPEATAAVESSADDAAVEDAAATASEAPAAEEVPAELPADTVLATVGETQIRWADAQFIFRNLLNTYRQYGLDENDPSLILGLRGQATQYAVELEVMKQKAAELNITLTEAEVAEIANEVSTRWNTALDQIVAQNPAITDTSTDADKIAAREEAIAELNGEGYSEASLLESAKETAVLRKLQTEMLKDVTVTDEEVQAAFDERVKKDEAAYADDISGYEYAANYSGETIYFQPAGYRGITHILLDVDAALLDTYSTLKEKLAAQQENATVEATATDTPAADATDAPTEEPPVTQAQVDAARQAILDALKPTLDEIAAKLQGGASFGDLVAEYGKDPGMTQEPNKSEGYRVHKDSVIYDQAFTNGAFSEKMQQVGDVSDPVISGFGVHLLHYLRDIPAGPVAFTEEIKAALSQQLRNGKEKETFQTLIAEWTQAASVVYTEEGQALLDGREAAQ